MTAPLDHMERRIARLERELRAFRIAGMIGVALAAAVSCDAPPASPPTSFELTSEDGARRVQLDLEGLRIEAGARSANYRLEGLVLHDGELGVTLFADGMSMSGAEGGLASVRPASMFVSSGTGRAAIEV